MRLFVLIVGAAAASLPIVPATAQSSFMADAIGQAVANANRSAPAACYDGRWAAKPKNLEKGITRAEALIQRYKQQFASGPDLKKLFINSKARWQYDGQRQNVRNLHDPWAARTARLERIALTVGNYGIFYHVQWRAFAADGSFLGIYDALLNSNGTQFTWLDLYSPGASGKPTSNTPFCNEPGDVEAWQAAKQKRAAEKLEAR